MTVRVIAEVRCDECGVTQQVEIAHTGEWSASTESPREILEKHGWHSPRQEGGSELIRIDLCPLHNPNKPV